MDKHCEEFIRVDMYLAGIASILGAPVESIGVNKSNDAARN